MRKIIITLILTVYTALFSLKAQNIEAKITNGFPIEIQNVPYQVSIQDKGTGSHFCGGSIINGKYVLTAAHCFRGINASDITLNVGFSLQNNPGNNIQTYNAKRIVIHPNYDNSTKDFDVAVIEIDGTFSFNNFVRPIELISTLDLLPETIGNQVRVSGWGWTIPNQRSGISNQLQAVDVPIISNQIADGQLDISSPNHPELTQRMLSTGAVGVDRQGACHGDSGGPLVFRQNGQNDIQIGVVSWGVSKCVGGENSPSIYARLSQLIDWIDDEVWNFANIQGDNTVCYNSSKTFTVQGIPNFINILNWQVSSNNVTILSSSNNSVTIRAVSSNSTGYGWVRANLSNGIILRKEFWVGKPKAYTRYPDPTICTNVFVQPTPYSLPTSPGAVSYELTSNSSSLFVDNFAYPEAEITMIANQPGNYTITLKTENPCGSSQATIYVTAQQCGGGGFEFRAYPNPTTSTLTIENTKKTESRKTTQNHRINDNSYELYNFNSNLVLKGKLKELTEIDVSNLKRGTYFLRIYTNGNIETHQIIIK